MEINSSTPHTTMMYLIKLGSYLSTSIGLIERLDTMEAEHFVNNRESEKTDLGTKKKWKLSKEGIRQNFWETRCKRLKILIETLEKLYYHSRGEEKQVNKNYK
jgi:hypothetical protein